MLTTNFVNQTFQKPLRNMIVLVKFFQVYFSISNLLGIVPLKSIRLS
jgi:hypothetical protein